jgi:hypothetical protein
VQLRVQLQLRRRLQPTRIKSAEMGKSPMWDTKDALKKRRKKEEEATAASCDSYSCCVGWSIPIPVRRPAASTTSTTPATNVQTTTTPSNTFSGAPASTQPSTNTFSGAPAYDQQSTNTFAGAPATQTNTFSGAPANPQPETTTQSANTFAGAPVAPEPSGNAYEYFLWRTCKFIAFCQFRHIQPLSPERHHSLSTLRVFKVLAVIRRLLRRAVTDARK